MSVLRQDTAEIERVYEQHVNNQIVFITVYII